MGDSPPPCNLHVYMRSPPCCMCAWLLMLTICLCPPLSLACCPMPCPMLFCLLSPAIPCAPAFTLPHTTTQMTVHANVTTVTCGHTITTGRLGINQGKAFAARRSREAWAGAADGMEDAFALDDMAAIDGLALFDDGIFWTECQVETPFSGGHAADLTNYSRRNGSAHVRSSRSQHQVALHGSSHGGSRQGYASAHGGSKHANKDPAVAVVGARDIAHGRDNVSNGGGAAPGQPRSAGLYGGGGAVPGVSPRAAADNAV